MPVMEDACYLKSTALALPVIDIQEWNNLEVLKNIAHTIENLTKKRVSNGPGNLLILYP